MSTSAKFGADQFQWRPGQSCSRSAPAAVVGDTKLQLLDPYADGWHTLDAVRDDLRLLEAVLVCAGEMFCLMERLDESDLGSPGPLVHALESTGTSH